MTRSHFQPHLLRFSCRIEKGCKPESDQFLVEKRAKKIIFKICDFDDVNVFKNG